MIVLLLTLFDDLGLERDLLSAAFKIQIIIKKQQTMHRIWDVAMQVHFIYSSVYFYDTLSLSFMSKVI